MTGASPVQKPFFSAPSKKFWALLLTTVAAILASGIESGFDETERAMAATALVGLTAAYVKSNDSTVTGDGTGPAVSA